MENIDNSPQPEQITQQSQSETKTNFSLSQKKLYLIIITALILVFLVIGFVIFQANQQAQPISLNQMPISSDKTSQQSYQTATSSNNTADWLTYQDEKVGFSFKYPPSVAINGQFQQPNQLVIYITTDKIANIPQDLPMNMGQDSAIQEKNRLANGQGENIVKIGSTYGQKSYTHSLFEECSVMFSRRLTFYQNDYRIIVSLIGPKEQIMSDMPGFFKIDPALCGENKMWDKNYELNFEETLKNQQGTGMGQEWYNTFEAITENFSLTVPKVSTVASPSPTDTAN